MFLRCLRIHLVECTCLLREYNGKKNSLKKICVSFYFVKKGNSHGKYKTTYIYPCNWYHRLYLVQISRHHNPKSSYPLHADNSASFEVVTDSVARIAVKVIAKAAEPLGLPIVVRSAEMMTPEGARSEA